MIQVNGKTYTLVDGEDCSRCDLQDYCIHKRPLDREPFTFSELIQVQPKEENCLLNTQMVYKEVTPETVMFKHVENVYEERKKRKENPNQLKFNFDE